MTDSLEISDKVRDRLNPADIATVDAQGIRVNVHPVVWATLEVLQEEGFLVLEKADAILEET